MKTENKWRDSCLRPILDSLPNCEYMIKEAKAIRALPDIIGVFRGVPFYLEVKRSVSELSCPRTRLQEYTLRKYKDAGAFTSFIYPENAQEVLKDLVLSVRTGFSYSVLERKKLMDLIDSRFSKTSLESIKR